MTQETSTNSNLQAEYRKAGLAPPPKGTDEWTSNIFLILINLTRKMENQISTLCQNDKVRIEQSSRAEQKLTDLESDLADLRRNGCHHAESHLKIRDEVKDLMDDKKEAALFDLFWEKKKGLFKTIIAALVSISTIIWGYNQIMILLENLSK